MCSELERDAESGRTPNAMAGLAQAAVMTAMKWARLRSSIRVFGNGRCNGMANLGQGVVLAPKIRPGTSRIANSPWWIGHGCAHK